MKKNEKIPINKLVNQKCTFFSKIFNDEILVYKHNHNYYAISSFCPHFGGPLVKNDKEIYCYWHGWKFDPESKKCKNHKTKIKPQEYKVLTVNNQLILSKEENDN